MIVMGPTLKFSRFHVIDVHIKYGITMFTVNGFQVFTEKVPFLPYVFSPCELDKVSRYAWISDFAAVRIEAHKVMEVRLLVLVTFSI